MSLAINVDSVTAVLLADGWHYVTQDGPDALSSFDIDAYEMIQEPEPGQDAIVLLGGGVVDGVPSTGFSFREAGVPGLISGPLTAILALRWAP